MLGRSEFALRQGFAAQNACTAHERRPAVRGPGLDCNVGEARTRCLHQIRGVTTDFSIPEVRGPRESGAFLGCDSEFEPRHSLQKRKTSILDVFLFWLPLVI